MLVATPTGTTIPRVPTGEALHLTHVARLQVHIPAAWRRPARDQYIVFRLRKADRLMTPHAHFYGHTAYGLLGVPHHNARRWLQGKDMPTQNCTVATARLLLTDAHGCPFPHVPAPELCPGVHSPVHRRVNLRTWRAARVHDVLWLAPDPDRAPARHDAVWTAVPPPRTGADMVPLSALAPDALQPVLVVALGVTGQAGRCDHRGRCLTVQPLGRKVVASPLLPYAGAHVFPGRVPGNVARRTASPEARLLRGPDLVLAPGEDMTVNGVDVRVGAQIRPGNYYAYKLM